MKLYHAPLTRSIRVLWLLEELGLPYELEVVKFSAQKSPFGQASPYGKVPALVDGDVTLIESGAIVEWILERHDAGRLGPRAGEPERADLLQWIHFAEATVMPPLGEIVRHTIFKPEAERIPAVVADARQRLATTLGVVERRLEGRDHLLDRGFSAADVMMGVSLLIARRLQSLDPKLTRIAAYLARLEARPALQTAMR